MNAVAFDTLRTARALEGKGFSREQSEGLAEQLAEGRTVDLSHLATKDELKHEISVLRSDLRSDISELKADMLKFIVGAVVLNGALIVGGMLGVAKLLGH